MSKLKHYLPLLSAALIIFVTGLSAGYSMGYFQSARASFPEIKEAGELNPGIATIKFLKLENGFLKGEVSGQKARLAYNLEDITDVQPGGTFEIPIYQVTLGQYYSARDLPEGMQYIASRQGKYYYNVLDPKAFSITPKNRVYFSLQSEAEAMGYQPYLK